MFNFATFVISLLLAFEFLLASPSMAQSADCVAARENADSVARSNAATANFKYYDAWREVEARQKASQDAENASRRLASACAMDRTVAPSGPGAGTSGSTPRNSSYPPEHHAFVESVQSSTKLTETARSLFAQRNYAAACASARQATASWRSSQILGNTYKAKYPSVWVNLHDVNGSVVSSAFDEARTYCKSPFNLNAVVTAVVAKSAEANSYYDAQNFSQACAAGRDMAKLWKQAFNEYYATPNRDPAVLAQLAENGLKSESSVNEKFCSEVRK
jgi:hypothetical protein